MSALSYICGYGYGSNSDDSDCEYGYPYSKRPKLPPPDLSKVPVVHSEEHIDDSELHEGRTRSFPHVRGNWATFVFIPIPEEDNILNIIDKLKKQLSLIGESSQTCDDLHISLSKTVVLKYHEIKSFTSSLQESVQNIKSFKLVFDSVKVYCNEDRTRTFIALKVANCSNKYLSLISRAVDKVLVDYNLQTFYECNSVTNHNDRILDEVLVNLTNYEVLVYEKQDSLVPVDSHHPPLIVQCINDNDISVSMNTQEPSFHVSVLWVNGYKVTGISNILDNLNTKVLQEIEDTPGTLSVRQIQCKSGNKYFQYSLL